MPPKGNPGNVSHPYILRAKLLGICQYDLGLPHCYSSFFFQLRVISFYPTIIATKSLDQPLSTIILGIYGLVFPLSCWVSGAIRRIPAARQARAGRTDRCREGQRSSSHQQWLIMANNGPSTVLLFFFCKVQNVGFTFFLSHHLYGFVSKMSKSAQTQSFFSGGKRMNHLIGP